jgi:hypothetical protein
MGRSGTDTVVGPVGSAGLDLASRLVGFVDIVDVAQKVPGVGVDSIVWAVGFSPGNSLGVVDRRCLPQAGLHCRIEDHAGGLADLVDNPKLAVTADAWPDLLVETAGGFQLGS